MVGYVPYHMLSTTAMLAMMLRFLTQTQTRATIKLMMWRWLDAACDRCQSSQRHLNLPVNVRFLVDVNGYRLGLAACGDVQGNRGCGHPKGGDAHAKRLALGHDAFAAVCCGRRCAGRLTAMRRSKWPIPVTVVERYAASCIKTEMRRARWVYT